MGWFWYRFLLLCWTSFSNLREVVASSIISQVSSGNHRVLKVSGTREAPDDDGAGSDLDDSVYSSADTGGNTWRAQYEEDKAWKQGAEKRERDAKRELEEEARMLKIYEEESRVRDRALKILKAQKKAANEVYEKQRSGGHSVRSHKRRPNALVRRHSTERSQWWGGASSYFTRFQKEHGGGDGDGGDDADNVPDIDDDQPLHDIFNDEVNSASSQSKTEEDADVSGDIDQSNREEQENGGDASEASSIDSRSSTGEDANGGSDWSHSRENTGSEDSGLSSNVASTGDQTSSDDGNQDGEADIGHRGDDVDSISGEPSQSVQASTDDTSDMSDEGGDVNEPNAGHSEDETSASNDPPSDSDGISHTYR